jgi:thimet oligopeptidase
MSRAFSRGCILLLLLGLVVESVAAQGMPESQPPVWSATPDIAAFEKMENNRLASAQRAIDKLVAVRGSRTIGNTLVPYDQAFEQIDDAINLATVIEQVHPEAAFREHATTMNSKANAAQTALSLNRGVYQALSALDVSKEDAATRYYMQRQMLEFRLAGVDKDDATRGKLKKLQEQLTHDQSMLVQNVSDDPKTIEVTNVAEMEGLPQDYIDSHKPGADGKIHIAADETNIILVLQFAKSDALRRRFWDAYHTRAYPKNRDVLRDMMQVRYEIATLLGYRSWADYNAADNMMVTGRNIAKFIEELNVASRPIAEREFAMLLAEKRKTDPGATQIFDYEYDYLSELVRRSQYHFDSESVRPYLPFNQVKFGIFQTASTLFHISFRQEQNVQAWDPSVETWDVIDNGKAIGRFYLDMFPRPGKYTHFEMAPLIDGIRGRQLPEAALVCNFSRPTATDPGLANYDDVTTFLHEFGHLMHYILAGQQQWAGIGGISMETDFHEAPSQMLEEWMHSPQVLATFAHQYQTGETIPTELVARMN